MIIQGPPSDSHLLKAYLPFLFWNGYTGWFLFCSLIGGIIIGFSDYEGIILSFKSLNTAQADGKITDAYYSSTEGVLGREEDIYGFEYNFSVNGIKYSDKSYAKLFPEEVGKYVIIRYLTSNPKISVIEGMAGGPLPKWVSAIGLIFSFLGIIIFALHIKKIIRQIYILRSGVIVKGMFLSEVKIPSKKFFSMNHNLFEYQYKGKAHEIGLDRMLFTTDFKEGDEVWMIHHKDDPEKVVLADNLPKLLKRNFIPLKNSTSY